MSLKNFLDLRKKVDPQIKIVERVILQKRSLKSDVFLALSVILVASAVIWGISKADSLSDFFSSPQVPAKSFSITGKVTEITDKTLSIDSGVKKEADKPVLNIVDSGVEATTTEVVGSTTDASLSSSTADIIEDAPTTTPENPGEGNLNTDQLIQKSTSTNESEATTTSGIINTIIESASNVIENVVNIFTPTTSAEETPSVSSTDTFDISKVSSIQTNHFKTLSILDIKVGDNVILQGVDRGGSITIFKIFSYSTEVATGILTEETATTAEEVATTTAPTTDEVATTTASTTEELNSSSTDSASSTPKTTIIDVIKDVVGDVINAITRSGSTPTDSSSATTSTDQNETSLAQTPSVEAPATAPATNDFPAVISPTTSETPTDTSQPTN